MSVRNCVELQRSNLLLHSVTRNLKAVNENYNQTQGYKEKTKNNERTKDPSVGRRNICMGNSSEKLKN